MAFFAVGLSLLIFSGIILQRGVRRHPGKPATYGLYSLIRNSGYFAGILINVGFLIIDTSVSTPPSALDFNAWELALVTAVGVLLFWLAAWVEEGYNVSQFGDAYKRYLNDVPRLNPIEGWRRLKLQGKEDRSSEV